MDLVSVIIPTHNRSRILRTAVESVLLQDYEHVQVIVVDDASSDDTAEVIRNLSEPRVIYLRHAQNRGPSAARNTGITAAEGEYIAFLDSDDIWSGDKLTKQVANLRGAPNAGYSYCGWLWVSSDTGKVLRRRVPDPRTGLICGRLRWMYNMVQDLLVRREVARRTLFREDMHSYENLDWLLRLGVGRAEAFVPEALVTCYEHAGPRVSDSSMAKVNALTRILAEQGMVIRKHPAFEHQLTLALGVLSLQHAQPGARRLLARAVRLRPYSVRSWAHLALASWARA